MSASADAGRISELRAAFDQLSRTRAGVAVRDTPAAGRAAGDSFDVVCADGNGGGVGVVRVFHSFADVYLHVPSRAAVNVDRVALGAAGGRADGVAAGLVDYVHRHLPRG